ncbi:hypothetical protein SNE40_013429 [Patella caerulea]|uniref:Mesencephalic astrocyte-derived neurotrophic factor homolog n=1 Tax=Patella caerulea TaxID=87958 RepID=A0AAN8JCA4_PATCE
MKNYLTACCVLVVVYFNSASAALKGDDCEVCLKTVKKFKDEYETKLASKNPSIDDVENLFRKFCKGLKGKEERFCYYLGGVETSATGILNKISGPVKNHLPADLICERLKKADSQICELKYEKTVDFLTVNLNKLKVKELKKILDAWGEYNACKGCAEKSDFVKKIEELLPKYEPEAAKARKEKSEL